MDHRALEHHLSEMGSAVPGTGFCCADADGLSRQALLFSKDALVYQGEDLPGQKCTQDSSGPNKKKISND